MAPNGYVGSKAEWARIERPLVEVDAIIGAFVRERGLSCSANSHSWPERSIVWGSGVRRLIEIFLEDEQRLRFRVWLCASQDRGRERFWKQETLRAGLSADELKAELASLLSHAYDKVNSWHEASFEFATRLPAAK